LRHRIFPKEGGKGRWKQEKRGKTLVSKKRGEPDTGEKRFLLIKAPCMDAILLGKRGEGKRIGGFFRGRPDLREGLRVVLWLGAS